MTNSAGSGLFVGPDLSVSLSLARPDLVGDPKDVVLDVPIIFFRGELAVPPLCFACSSAILVSRKESRLKFLIRYAVYQNQQSF